MTPEEIEEIRERVDAVKANKDPVFDEEYPTPCCYWTNGDREGEEIDRRFIQHSVEDMDRLLAALEEAEARVGELERALKDLHDGYYAPTKMMAGLGPIQCDWCERENEAGDPQALVHDEGCMVDTARRLLQEGGG